MAEALVKRSSARPIADACLETVEAKAWIQEQVSKEATRIKDSGARAIPLPVKNCGVLVEHCDINLAETSNAKGSKKRRIKVVNRMEIGSGMDFRSITQIMVSEPQNYPFAPGYHYVHILAFTASSNGSIALLLPYIYAPYLKMGPISTGMLDAVSAGQEVQAEVIPAGKTDKLSFENTLKDWLLINEKHTRARHSIKEYHSIG